MITTQQASVDDIDRIKELLDEHDLVTEGVEDFIDDFLILAENQSLIGCIGLEVYESVALLRSIAVQSSHQKKGYGLILLKAIEKYASELGVSHMYLLTDTAESFFKKYGYSICDRNNAPSSIAATREFSEFCPSSSAFMMKELHEK